MIWEIHYIVLDIVSNFPHFVSLQVQHCYREANKVADLMANQGHSFLDPVSHTPPFDVDFSLFVRKDVLGWPPD